MRNKENQNIKNNNLINGLLPMMSDISIKQCIFIRVYKIRRAKKKMFSAGFTLLWCDKVYSAKNLSWFSFGGRWYPIWLKTFNYIHLSYTLFWITWTILNRFLKSFFIRNGALHAHWTGAWKKSGSLWTMALIRLWKYMYTCSVQVHECITPRIFLIIF